MIDAGVSAAPAPTDTTATTPPAASVPSVPDPTVNPAATVTSAWSLVKQFGYVWGGMLVLFGLGTIAIKKAEDEHWLAAGHTLSILTSTIGILGAVLQWKFAGASPAGIVMAAMAAVMLIVQKPKKSAAQSQGGTASTAPPAAAPA